MTDTGSIDAPRVLIVAKTLDVGGAERLVVDGLRRWKGTAEVAYLSGDGILAAELRAMGRAVHDLSSGGRIGLRTLVRLRALLSSDRFDLVHAHLPAAGILVRLLGTRLPIVYTEHNVWEAYRAPVRWLNWKTFNRNTEVIAVSTEVLTSLRQRWTHARPPVTVVLNGIAPRNAEAEVRDRVRQREGVADGSLVVLTVASLFPRKGHDVLLDALSRGPLSSQDVVWLAGEGPSRTALERQAAKLRGPQVRFLGLRHDVRDLMSASDVFVMPSRFEGLPVALLEALDSGLPAIATDVGGIPEVLEGGVGVVVPPEQPQLLADALASLAGEPERRAQLGAAGRQRVRERFSSDRMDALTLGVYRRALQGGRH